MFEKRPIWCLIVGLNVCVLIWLISVQEPVMYDANSAVIISGSLEQQQQQQGGEEGDGLYGAGGGGGVKGFDFVNPSSRILREDRDVYDKKHQQQQQQLQQQQRPLYTIKHNDVTSTLTTLNISTKSSSNSKYSSKNIYSSTKNNSKTKNLNSTKNNINSLNINFKSPNLKLSNDSKELIQTIINDSDSNSETLSTNVLSSSSVASFGMQHSLTSSLGTGMHDFTKVKPTPSWRILTAVSSALPNEDFNRLIDLQHFHYLVPQPVCSTDIQALILVHSAPKNYEKRQIIRETWASIGHHKLETPLRVLFLLGAVESDETQRDLMKENNDYADIIQGSFIDDYRNMTYKHVMAFKWYLYNCPHAQILIKVDDDVYVNTPQLMDYIREEHKRRSSQESEENPTTTTNINNSTTNSNIGINSVTSETKSNKQYSLFETWGIFSQDSEMESTSSSSPPPFKASENLFHRPQNLLFCQKIIGSMVKRSYRSKWRVGFKEFAGRYYPPYCPGYAIIYSSDVVFRLYTAAQEAKYFWIDDVHITGVLAQQTNTTITTSSHYVLYSDECDRLLEGKTDLNDVEFLFAWHSITARQIKALWHLQMMAQRREDVDENYGDSNNQINVGSKSSSSPSSSSASLYSYNISNYLAPEDFR